MADILGIKPRWLQLMVADGRVPSHGRGRFVIGEVVQAHATLLKEGERKREKDTSLDELRKEKAEDIRLARAMKDRTVIRLDETMAICERLTGLYLSSLSALPARITNLPRERHRLNDILDAERLRLRDSLAKVVQDLEKDDEASGTSAEDDTD